MAYNFKRRTTSLGLEYNGSAHKYYWDIDNNIEATITAGLADCTTYVRGRAMEIGLPCPMNQKGDASTWHNKLINNWKYFKYSKNDVQPGDIIEWSNGNNHVAFVEDVKDNKIYVSASWYTGENGKSYIDGKYDKRTSIKSLQELSDLMIKKWPYRFFHYCTIEEENKGVGGEPTYIIRQEEIKVKAFTKRYSKPTASNLEYVRTGKGGWSRCCQGSPTDSACDSLANCVGYACGRFNEIYNEIMGTTGMKYYALNCNAENFIERAKDWYPELQFSADPVEGGIICWAKGKVGVGDDGAGHVAICEEILERDANGRPTKIKTSESAYQGTAFYVSTRTNDNGRWGMREGYSYRMSIVNPAIGYGVNVVPVDRDIWKDQVEVKVKDLNMRAEPTTASGRYGFCPVGIFNVNETKVAAGYTWYNINGGVWIADCDGVDKTEQVEFLPKKVWNEPQPVEEDATKNQVFIGEVILRIRKDSSTSSEQMGLYTHPNKFFDVIKIEVKEDYTWYNIGEDAWIAGVEKVVYHPAAEEDDIKALKAEIKALKAQVSNLESTNKSLAEQNEKLKADLASSQAEAKELAAANKANAEIVKSCKEHVSAMNKLF